MEIWRDIEGFEGLYKVSDNGRVKSLGRLVKRNAEGKRGHTLKIKERIMKLTEYRGGYLQLYLSKDGRVSARKVHRLVAVAFIDNRYNKPQVNHLDGNKKNNKASNLEWCTLKENMMHASALGLLKPVYVPIIGRNKITNNKVEFKGITIAAVVLGINRKGIQNVLGGRAKTSGGFYWMYKN